MDLLAQTYFNDILHNIAQVALVPTVVLLIALVLLAIVMLGSLLAELVCERRHFTVTTQRLLAAIVAASPQNVPQVIDGAGLLAQQKEALVTLWNYRALPTESHVALARRLVEKQDARLRNKVSRAQVISKVAPMVGLMGTLIPLGPGIVSLSQGETATLSASLLVAFDTTVAGLIVSVFTFVVAKIRRAWYDDYMAAFEAAVTAVLEKTEHLRESGAVPTAEEDVVERMEWLLDDGPEPRRFRHGKRHSTARVGRAKAAPAPLDEPLCEGGVCG